ncbi:hypothetical protein N780_00270 [Pontibacillus chungwhensis BH030062]|uniref:Uncharacterized protein n=1 Tax=Pontibacillus chungwhensis BH030062 TaxID=1385513 RepID=A0A0A2VFH4_9BACI|nr:hypothetical protein N780_00270 [Pontibacillus chungwhensis BH030062]
MSRKYWFLYNVLFIFWSGYLLVIHISRKDHWMFQAILFGLFLVVITQLLNRYHFSKKESLPHVIASFALITGGHMLYTWITLL